MQEAVEVADLQVPEPVDPPGSAPGLAGQVRHSMVVSSAVVSIGSVAGSLYP